MAAFNFAVVLDELESEILRACGGESQWPAQVAAGVYAGVDFAIARPAIADELAQSRIERDRMSDYDRLIGRLAGFVRARAPHVSELPTATDEALVAGIVGLVGDHLRIDRADRLAELRPELVLLVLLPHLGFEEARKWANWSARPAE